jgi:glyoxylase-like metal-dependent hydrolase (beta-lactamase superfamily II)
MIRRIHSLNCGSLCPPCRAAVNGRGSLWEAGSLICHCLLLETDSSGLVLIDSGLGLTDIKDPLSRLGRSFLASSSPLLRESETAIRQVERLGYQARDVRHILLTHLDLDHAGGLGDFPEATVHLLHNEKQAAETASDSLSKSRYRPAQWAHVRRWETYSPMQGAAWRGLQGVQPLNGLGDDIKIVPLTGHTLGHSGYAIEQGSRTLLHCGDAYFHRGSIQGAASGSNAPWGLRIFQNLVAMDRARMHRTQTELRSLLTQEPKLNDIDLICAHDPEERETLLRTLKPAD